MGARCGWGSGVCLKNDAGQRVVLKAVLTPQLSCYEFALIQDLEWMDGGDTTEGKKKVLSRGSKLLSLSLVFHLAAPGF